MHELRRFLLCLLLVAAGCETEAAAPRRGFVELSELRPATVATIEAAVRQLPIESYDAGRLSYLPRTLGEAQRLIREQANRDLEPFQEACEIDQWLIFSHAAPDGDQRFRRGWMIERASLKLYPFEVKGDPQRGG